MDEQLWKQIESLVKFVPPKDFSWKEFEERWLEATYENHNSLQSIPNTNN